jgi:hypothetical protein
MTGGATTFFSGAALSVPKSAGFLPAALAVSHAFCSAGVTFDQSNFSDSALAQLSPYCAKKAAGVSVPFSRD